MRPKYKRCLADALNSSASKGSLSGGFWEPTYNFFGFGHLDLWIDMEIDSFLLSIQRD